MCLFNIYFITVFFFLCCCLSFRRFIPCRCQCCQFFVTLLIVFMLYFHFTLFFRFRLSAPINYESTVSNVVSYSPAMTRTHVASYAPAMTSTKVASYNPGVTRSQTISYTPAVSRAQASSYSIPAVTRKYVGTGGHKNSYHQASYRPGYCRRYHNKYRCKLFFVLITRYNRSILYSTTRIMFIKCLYK